jgi:lactate permease
LQQSLSGLALALTWGLDDTFRGAFQPPYHPGTMSFVGFFVGAFVTGRGGLVGEAMAAAMRRLFPVALALLVMLALSRWSTQA